MYITFLLILELSDKHGQANISQEMCGKFDSGLNCTVCCIQEPREPTLYATDEYTGHSLPGGQLAMSLHDEWLATAGRDGRLTLRQVGTLVRCCTVMFYALLICFVIGLTVALLIDVSWLMKD